MIIFMKNGRLGNQFFQINGMQKYYPEEKIYFIGLNEFSEAFIESSDQNISFLNPNRYVFFMIRYLLKFLLRFKLIGKISEIFTMNLFDIKRTRGVFFNIALAEDIYFQHKEVLNQIQNNHIIRKQYVSEANYWLESRNLSASSMNIVFIHIRRGDYLFVPSRKNPAVISLKWIESMISLFNKELDDPKYIVMGDDKMYLEDFLAGKEYALISNNSKYVDLALMSKCKYGILSASSFSLMGAHTSKSNHDNYKFVAPKYWMGSKIRSWLPLGVETDWIEYYDVSIPNSK